jgi:hypothetical protein
MVLRRGSRDLDFQHLVRRTLGGNMAVIASFVNVLVMLGASVAYHILMKDCLHVIGSAIIGWSDTPAANPLGPNSTNALTPSYMTANGEFLSSSSFSSAASSAVSLSTVPMHHDSISPALAFWNKHGEYAALMVLVAWPLTTLKNLTVLVKFNSLGVFFLFFNIFFIVIVLNLDRLLFASIGQILRLNFNSLKLCFKDPCLFFYNKIITNSTSLHFCRYSFWNQTNLINM